MIRDLDSLADRTFDVVVIGGGIFGACSAWEASLRGFSVALIEKHDFSHATSANHFKMVHCGIRYLQHADLRRLRESSRERSALLRIAPHLVHTLPIVIPTYGHGVKGKAFLGSGMLLYDALTVDRNRGLLPAKKIRPSRFLSAAEVIRRFPGIRRQGLTGAAVFEEGQMYNPPRLVLSFIHAAAAKGAVCANYVRATGFLKRGRRVFGVTATDELGGNTLEIRGRLVLNTAGPWAHRIMEPGLGLRLRPRPTFSRDLAFVVNRRFESTAGLALATDTKDADTLVDRGGRHLFAVPWREFTLIGVWHKVWHGPPETLTVSQAELSGYVREVNRAYPGLLLSEKEILMVNMGLTLFGQESHQAAGQISFGHRSQVIDHARAHGVEGLLTLIGVRATTARGMAAAAVDRIQQRLGWKQRDVDSTRVPIYGGDFDSFEELVARARKSAPLDIDDQMARCLCRNYGSQWAKVLALADQVPLKPPAIDGSHVLQCEVLHAVRHEMARKLSDVVLRRTDLGSGKMPSRRAVSTCAALMADELGWNGRKVQNEIADLRRSYPAWA